MANRWKGNLDSMLLSIIEHQPLHGYALIEELRRRSGGVFDLPEGSVYPALHRLERLRLVDSSTVEIAGRERRIYRLTAKGNSALADSRVSWREFTRAVTAVMRAST